MIGLWRRGSGCRQALVVALLLALLIPLRPSPAGGQGVLAIALDRGEGALYRIGDPVAVTYTLDAESWLRLTAHTVESSRVIFEGLGVVPGGEIRARVGEPEGIHTVVAEAFASPDATEPLATAQTWFVAAASPVVAPATPAPTPSPMPQRVVVSGVETGRTVQVPRGSTIQIVALEPTYRWAPFQFDSFVVQLDTAPGVLPASFTARNPGLTTISTTGSAPCRDAVPPCALPDLAFSITVIVQ